MVSFRGDKTINGSFFVREADVMKIAQRFSAGKRCDNDQSVKRTAERPTDAVVQPSAGADLFSFASGRTQR